MPGDAQRLQQVFVNLLSNAAKYAPHGTTIGIGAQQRDSQIEVWVEDAGPGLPAGDPQVLFERFRRGEASEPDAPGLGLGLWIVRSIVERHAGSVRVERTPEARTRFVMTLPMTPGPPENQAVKILLVDDDPDLLSVTSFALQQAGMLVVSANSFGSALAVFRSERPDLAILDINLPGGSGFELCQAMRRESALPILMLTVRNEEADLVRALELRADDYLTKPYSPRTLIARVKALLRRAGTDATYKSEAGPYRLDPNALELHVGSTTHRVTPLESRLLQMLIANAGQAVTTERLLTHVWGQRAGGDRQLLKQLVHRLRQKLGESPSAGHSLETVTNVGYRLRV